MTSLKKLIAVLAVSLPLAASAQQAAAPKLGLKFKFSGDLNNRFMLFTDQAGIYSGAETISPTAAAVTANPFAGRLSDDTVEEAWGELKYRFTAEASTEDGLARGVYGIEIGAIRFGDATRGGGYSGDGNNYETRFAYLDFGLPASPKTRITVGLQPFTVNRFLWSETATGVQAKLPAGPASLTLAWMRGNDVFTTSTAQEVFADGDNYLLRGDFSPMKDVKAGLFALYQHRNTELTGTGAANSASYLLKRFGANVDYDIYNVGADAALKFGNIFVNADLIYQTGNVIQKAGVRNLDLNGFVAHADVGVNLGAAKVTYTGWYASGDEDGDADGDLDNFIATDVDFFDSVILQEGGLTDDNYFTEAPYFLNFGAIFNKLAVDFKASDKLTVGAAVMYIMTAEDLPVGGGENVIGTEIDASLSYKLTPNVEIAANAGYLISGDAMDAFEVASLQDGKADADIFRATARIRYMF